MREVRSVRSVETHRSSSKTLKGTVRRFGPRRRAEGNGFGVGETGRGVEFERRLIVKVFFISNQVRSGFRRLIK